MAIIAIVGVGNAQEKYAVLITGDYAAKNVPIEDQWNQGQGKSVNGFEEFWYDTYLMWEMLLERGYSNDNIFVLFAGGTDFAKPDMWDRYIGNAQYPEIIPPDGQITDYSATIINVEDVFNGLSSGTGGFPQVTEDDFLFVWTFDHGGPDYDLPDPAYICLLDGNMYDHEFADLTDQIPAYKKVFWMQQCRAGGFYDDLEATNTVFHSAGQPLEYAYAADNVDLSGNQVEEWDFYYSGSDYYRHGEFNFHVYSATVGESPAFVNNYNGQPYTDADENSDNYISVLESYNWEDDHESIDYYSGDYHGEDPFYSDMGNIGANTSLYYPTLLFEDIGTSGETISHRGIIGISKDINVTSGNQLQFLTNSDVYLLNNADLIVDAGATLIIENNVTINGNASNQIIVNGNISLGDNVTFNLGGGNMILNNNNASITLDNSSFNNGQLVCYAFSLDINGSNISDCYFSSHRGFVTINNSTFDGVWTHFTNTSNPLPFFNLTITNCIFKNGPYAGLTIDEYDYFNITNNQIFNCSDGIALYNSGNGRSGNQNIIDNGIYNNSNCGLLIYNSTASITENYIHDNHFGVKFLNQSNITFFGNPGATSYGDMNLVEDNISYEIFSSGYSFPWYFRYNAIIDPDNLGGQEDALVYYEFAPGDQIPKDIRYNCWDSSFDPDVDLYPDVYLYNPTWCPGGGNIEKEVAEQLYTDANDFFENQQFEQAESSYKLLVDQYPDTRFANAALKDMFTLEAFNENNYVNLIQYYSISDSIEGDSTLLKTSIFLINKCNVMLEQWQLAIDHYEAIIAGPVTTEDSIFAIIDLGHAYLLMEQSGYKSSYGMLTEHIPVSQMQYEGKRDFLLGLLPGDQLCKTMKENIATLKEGELLQNVPNPFKGTTQIWYKLNTESNVQLKVYNSTGQLIKSINEGTKTKGTHHIDFDANGLKNGIYFYSISINGQTTDSKKMTIIK